VFQPLRKRGPKGHAAMVWVHGGVHGSWGITMFPFVKEAVARGYVIVAPDYRGSTGYGESFYQAIDYGGKEVEDTLERVESPEQIDSWTRTWAFFEWNLRPYEDRSKPVTYVDQAPRGRQ
jgi:dipeptidyl aminopeptidase/acylaminoacyl peptidase